MSKKTKKNKWKSVDLGSVLQETRPVTAWADEVEIDERELQIAAARKSALPTAPRSARGSDDERVPTSPPFVAYITNIPFETEEIDIAEFFGDLQIDNIRLPRNDGSGKLKGYGYVEFTERAGLIEALQIADTSMKGRRIRIDVSENNDRDRGYGRSDRMGRDRMGMGMGMGRDEDPDRAMGDWRSAPRVEPAGEDRQRPGARQGFGGGGFRDGEPEGRDRDRDRGGFGAPRETEIREGGWREGMGAGTGASERFGDRDRDSFRSRGFGDRDREGSDRDRGSRFGSGFGDRFGGDRDRDREGGDRPRYGDRDGDRYGGDRPRYGDREREEDRERFARREEGPPAEGTDNKPRVRLQLQPRTRPVETRAPTSEELTEKEIDEKEENEKEEKKAAPPAPRASIFGAAKPVDTNARDREIEERLAKEKDRAPRRDDHDRETSRAKEDGDQGDDEPRRAETAPTPKENVWTRRPRIEPSSNNGDASRNEDGDHRASSPGSFEGKEDTGRDRNSVNNKDRENSDGKGDEYRDEENRMNRSGSRDKKDDDFTDGKDEGSNTDRPSRRDHSNEDRRLPKFEEKPLPNFVASNKYAFLNEDGDQDAD